MSVCNLQFKDLRIWLLHINWATQHVRVDLLGVPVPTGNRGCTIVSQAEFYPSRTRCHFWVIFHFIFRSFLLPKMNVKTNQKRPKNATMNTPNNVVLRDILRRSVIGLGIL